MYHYVALVWNACEKADQSVRTLEISVTGTSGWSVAYKSRGALVAHCGGTNSSRAYHLQNRSGVVLGRLFKRHNEDSNTSLVTSLEGAESDRIAETKGRHLIEHYWGKYVAVIWDTSSPTYHVLRDPTAQMPCFHTIWNGIHIFFSHIEDCLGFVPATFSLNWRYIATHLLNDEKLTRECGLNEVDDVPGGERITLSDKTTERVVYWTPATFCRDTCYEDEMEAERALRRTVQSTVNALASCYDSVLHNLSGGLDSSVIAGCLAQAPTRPDVTCFNYFAGDTAKVENSYPENLSERYVAKLRRAISSGDERQFARLVAKRWEFKLVEYQRSIAKFDLNMLRAAPVAVRPSRYVHVIDIDQWELDLVRRTGLAAVFNGQAGDTVLYATQQSIGAIDYAYQHRLGRHLTSEIFKACAVSKESVWLVIPEVVKYGLLRRPKPPIFDPVMRPHLVTDDAFSFVRRHDLSHPWSKLAFRLPPGKRNHVLGIAGSALFYSREYTRERLAESIYPLAAQPIVELCLRIPVYRLLAGGISRGLARRAFADILPPEIAARTTKGYSFAFCQELIRANMPFVRQTLLDGVLVREAMLDRQKLEGYLVPDQPFRTVSAVQIMTYLATEAWLQQWTRIQETTTAHFNEPLLAQS